MGPVLDRHQERAEQVLSAEYAQLRHVTLYSLRGKLAASGIRFDRIDLEAFYNQAWHGLYLRLAQGEQIDNHTGFLVTAAYHRAIEEVRRSHPDRVADGAEVEEVGIEPDMDSVLDDHVELTHFMEGMRERLTERERQAAALCYIHGYTRPQTAEALGVSPKRMEKLMDAVSAKIGGLVADIRDASWCESRDSLMKAYAFGVLDPEGERWELASAHLSECPGCRRYVRGLRGIAAVAPPIGLPLAALALIGGGTAGAGAAAAGAGGGAAGAGGGAAGAGAGGSSGGGVAAAGTGAASGGGGIGAAGAAVAATAVVAAAGLGAFAIAGGGDEKPKAPPPAPPVAAVTSPASTPAPSPPKAKAKAKAKTKKKAASSTPATTPADVSAAPAAADTAASTPAPTAEATPEPTPAPAAQPAEEQPTTDGEQEFGFER